MLNTTDGIHTSDYVKYITTADVDGNAANAGWTASAPSTSYLGNLGAGSSEDQATKLTEKWFLGSDTPQIAAGSYLASDNDPLFSSAGPRYDDASQGEVGDCYLLSSLGEVALNDPDTIKSMFTDNGNDSWGVRFFDSEGQAEYVTVNDQLPQLQEPYLQWADGARQLYANGGGSKWVELAEKAYAQLNEEGVLGHGTSNAYQAIAGGDSSPVTQVTGKPSYIYSVTDGAVAWAATHGQEVEIATPSNVSFANGVGGHMFEVIGYDSGTATFDLHNPWGSAVSSNTIQTTFSVSAQELANNGCWAFAATGTSIGQHLTT